jgi:hypothetical protein
MGILVDPNQRVPSHPSEEILEEYVFHRLPEPLAAQVEEHLLICPSCQDAVGETDRFVSALRLANQPPAVADFRSGWRNILDRRPRLTIRRTTVIPVFALGVLALLAVRQYVQQPLSQVAVSLSSLRGSDPLAPAPAGRLLRLSIEAPDLVPGRGYRVELVDAAGSLVWKGAATASGGKLAVDMSEPLATGLHWVRLYGADSELLREFGLSAK